MRKNKYVHLIVLSLAVLLFSKCKVFDNEVIVPGYIYVPKYKLETKADGSQGDTCNNITDVWMYSQGNLEGAFALPALIPVQHTGTYEISFDAGVLRTGQFYERVPNKLMTREYFTVNLKPKSIDTLVPVFKYAPSNKFLLIEDFDRIGFRFYQYNPQEGDTIYRFDTGDSARVKGFNSGYVSITDSTTEYRLISSDVFSVSSPNSTIYLEMDYQSDVAINVGFLAASNSGRFTNVYSAYPNSTWKKVYIDLSPDLLKLPGGDQYRIVLYIIRAPGTPKPRILLDNFKLIEG